MANILLATTNSWKVEHYKEMLNYFKTGIDVNIPIRTINVEEDGETLIENSRKKAKAYYDAFRVPVIADDTGLFVDILDGYPGVHTKRELHGDYNILLAKMVKINKLDDRTAKFMSAITIIDSNGNMVSTETSRDGFISFQGKGKNGIYTEKIFIPKSFQFYGEDKEMYNLYTLGSDELKVDRFFHQIFTCEKKTDPKEHKKSFLDLIKELPENPDCCKRYSDMVFE